VTVTGQTPKNRCFMSSDGSENSLAFCLRNTPADVINTPICCVHLLEKITMCTTLTCKSFISHTPTRNVLHVDGCMYEAHCQDASLRSAIKGLPIHVCIGVVSTSGAVSLDLLSKYKLLVIVALLCLAVGVGLFALWKPGVSNGIKYGPWSLSKLASACSLPVAHSP
jgi:hypothetical protein